jgi:predicted nucleic acid-binding protein
VSSVLDSSATLAWLYSDEIADAVRRVFEAVAEHGAVVPALWRLEVADSLTMAARGGRIDSGLRDAALCDLALEITTDPHTEANAWSQTLQLADRCGLTVYDAAYLELALRRRLPLATLDERLRAGAITCGVEVLGQD